MKKRTVVTSAFLCFGLTVGTFGQSKPSIDSVKTVNVHEAEGIENEPNLVEEWADNATGREEFIPFWADSGDALCGDGSLQPLGAVCGDFMDTHFSDNEYWGANYCCLVCTLIQFELEFTNGVPDPVAIDVDIEASKQNNNADLVLRALLFNFTTGQYEALAGTMVLTTTDTIRTFSLAGGADPSDFIEEPSKKVVLLLQIFKINGFPTTKTQLDEVVVCIR